MHKILRKGMKKAEEKARVYAKKRIVLENRDKFSDEANLRAAEYYAYKAYLAGYNQGVKDLSENKFNPDDYECLAGVCPDLSDEEHCENCSLKRLKRSIEPKEELRCRDPKSVLVKYRTANVWRFLPEMPEEKEEVLVAFKFFDIPVQAYWDGKTWKASFEVRDTMKDGYCNDSTLCMQEDIYAWMELPVKPAFP